MNPVRVMIGMPNGGTVTNGTVRALCKMAAYYATSDIQLAHYMCEVGMYLELARSEIVHVALRERQDYLFFVDHDVEFPETALRDMIQVDRDVVSLAYRDRGERVSPVIGHIMGRPMRINGHEVLEVEGAPCGALLVKRHVLEGMCAKFPELAFERPAQLGGGGETLYHLFKTMICADPNRGGRRRMLGEDIAFCVRARQAGYRVFMMTEIATVHGGKAFRLADHSDQLPPPAKPFELLSEPADVIAKPRRAPRKVA